MAPLWITSRNGRKSIRSGDSWNLILVEKDLHAITMDAISAWRVSSYEWPRDVLKFVVPPPVFGRCQARLKLLWRPRQTFTSTRLHIHGTSGYEHRNNHNPMVARWSRNPSRFIKTCKIYITRIFTEDTSFSLRVLFIKPTEDSFHLFTYLRNVKGKIFAKLIRF